MKNFGFTDYDEVSCLGTNAKMNEACAAMGLTSLESVDRFIAVNRVNFECYAQELSGIRGMSLIRYNDRETSNYQYVVTEIDETVAGINRDIMQQILQAENVIARRYFYPGCHRMEPYRSHCPNVHLAHTDMLVRRVVCLPTGTTIAPPMISTICELIRLVVENASEVQARLASTLSRLGKVPR
jgi:dTDP-4-amino-4,6-dideoxygalactose transaminase